MRNPDLGRSLVYGLVALALLLTAHGTYFAIEQRKDQQYLQSIVLPTIAKGDEEKVLLSTLVASFDLPPHRGRGNASNYGIKHPGLKALGPPASLVHVHGGHCGRRTRLMIALLALNDIPARKVHLINEQFLEFHHSHRYVHAVVEAKIDERWVIADPLFNMVYRNSSGDLATLQDIRNDPLTFTRGVAEADTTYAPYPVELYTYDNYRNFIWNSIPGGELFYSMLEALAGEEHAKQIAGPRTLEQPLLLMAWVSFLGAGVLCFLAAAIHFRRRIRRQS
jgi:hypothetical protein